MNTTREAIRVHFLTRKLIFTISPIARKGSIIYIDFRDWENADRIAESSHKKVFTIYHGLLPNFG